MDYKQKYLKYKIKYSSLKNLKYIDIKSFNQKGGAIKYNNINISDNNLTTILNYDINTHILKASIGRFKKSIPIVELNRENLNYKTDSCIYELIPYSESNFNLTNFYQNLIEFDTLIFNMPIIPPDTYILRITQIDTQNYIEIYDKIKIFVIKFTINNYKYELVIQSDIEYLEDNFYIHKQKYYSRFNLKINNSTIKFEIIGKLKIIKDVHDRTNKTNDMYFNIESINNIQHTIKEFKDINNFIIETFNFQNAYDRLKSTNNKCPESTILFKHIYNSFYTQKLINNYEHWLLLHNYLGKILEFELETNINNSGTNIINICSDKDKRQLLLKNTMKRIETTHMKGFLIKNNSNSFIPIESIISLATPNKKFKIIFDTGNQALSLINIQFVQALGLTVHKTFKISTESVSGHSTINDEYVDVELKLDSNLYNIDISKIFKFRAYVQHVGLEHTLLLGQSANSLKQFFDESYCIGFDEQKSNYDAQYKSAHDDLQKYIKQYKNILDSIKKLSLAITTGKINRLLIHLLTLEIVIITKLMSISSIIQYINDTHTNDINTLYTYATEIQVEYNRIKKDPSIINDVEITNILTYIHKYIISNI